MSEQTLYQSHPSMFRNDPLTFVICIASIPGLAANFLFESGWLLALSPIFALTLVWLVKWWIETLRKVLIITDQRVIKRTGIFEKHVTEIYHADAHNIQVDQNFLQRLLDAGDVSVASAATGAVEIKVEGLPHPERAQKIIEGYHQEYLKRWRHTI